MPDWTLLERDICNWLSTFASNTIQFRNSYQAIVGFPPDGPRSDSVLANDDTLIAVEIESRQLNPDTNVGKYWLLYKKYRAYRKIILFHIYTPLFNSKSGASQDDYWFVEEYVRALDENRDHECSGAEAQHVLEIMMGIFESSAYGKRVELPQELRDHPLLRWRQEHDLSEPAAMPRAYGQWLEAEDGRRKRPMRR